MLLNPKPQTMAHYPNINPICTLYNPYITLIVVSIFFSIIPMVETGAVPKKHGTAESRESPVKLAVSVASSSGNYESSICAMTAYIYTLYSSSSRPERMHVSNHDHWYGLKMHDPHRPTIQDWQCPKLRPD